MKTECDQLTAAFCYVVSAFGSEYSTKAEKDRACELMKAALLQHTEAVIEAVATRLRR